MAIQDLGGLLISRPECPLVFGEKRYPVKSFDEGVTISAKDQQEYTNAFERVGVFLLVFCGNRDAFVEGLDWIPLLAKH